MRHDPTETPHNGIYPRRHAHVASLLRWVFLPSLLLLGVVASPSPVQADPLADLKIPGVRIQLHRSEVGNYKLVILPLVKPAPVKAGEGKVSEGAGSRSEDPVRAFQAAKSGAQPRRLVVDYYGLAGKGSKNSVVKDKRLKAIRIGDHTDRTRIVIDVKSEGTLSFGSPVRLGTGDAFRIDFTVGSRAELPKSPPAPKDAAGKMTSSAGKEKAAPEPSSDGALLRAPALGGGTPTPTRGATEKTEMTATTSISSPPPSPTPAQSREPVADELPAARKGSGTAGAGESPTSIEKLSPPPAVMPRSSEAPPAELPQPAPAASGIGGASGPRSAIVPDLRSKPEDLRSEKVLAGSIKGEEGGPAVRKPVNEISGSTALQPPAEDGRAEGGRPEDEDVVAEDEDAGPQPDEELKGQDSAPPPPRPAESPAKLESPASPADAPPAETYSGPVLSDFGYEKLRDSGNSAVYLDVSKLQRYSLEKRRDDLYELRIEGARLGRNGLSLPRFAPDGMDAFDLVSARQEGDSVIVRIFVDEGVRLFPFVAEGRLWIKALR